MHDVMRKRILRKLEALPEAQLYQVLDFVEFLEARYAAEQSARSTGFQAFAERLEDSMRARSLATRAVTGTMKIVSTAGKVIDGITGVFEAPPPRERPGGSRLPARNEDAPRRVADAATRGERRPENPEALPGG